MYFHSWPFILFFLLFYPTHLALKGTRFRLPLLLAASYFFYAWAKPSYLLVILYLFLILYVSLVDYLMVVLMSLTRWRKLCLSVSIINSLALLVIFKYGTFVTDNINILLSSLSIPYVVPAPGIFLPVGLSFYIFQSMSYTIDYYRGNIEREKSFIRYATFVSLFPRLLAGPIERAKNLLPQLHKTPRVSMQDIADGLSLFVVGFFKKVALADYLALYVNNVYAAPEQSQSPALLLATFLFAWQIYFDFSGYTDMARGIARMMGLRLMLNFNNPYLATSLGDFWSRWHISLSSWFKDYVYIPLGGNRRGKFNTYRNIFLTMVISGLWHAGLFDSPAWTFIIWAVVHALGYCLMRELERTSFYRDKVPKLAKQLFVFGFVTFAWIFFRAESITDAWVIITRIFTSGFADSRCPVLALASVFAVWLYQFAYESRVKWFLEARAVRIGIVVLMVLYLAIFAPSSEQPFIYLQF
ncbi:MAG: MBOAT family O-acyltransferase [Planctomycetota bacterium]|jgi:D-alanyl-lipoteichoic acid acyltransferase DltB (MBOAT superfamily)